MNKRTFNNETITAYLLGVLPETEAENFDELSFTDDNFADELKAAEKDLVDAYVSSDLQGTELEQFKSYYLASPIRREKVKFAQAFQAFAEKELAEAQEEPAAVVETEPKRPVAGFFSNIFALWRPTLQWGFAAATLLLMFFGGWFWLENNRLREQASETEIKRNELARREQELQKQLENERSQNSETEKELARVREERQRIEEELQKEQEQKQQIITQKQKTNEPRTETTPKQISSPRQISIASFILPAPVRGNIENISIPARTDSVAMQLQLEANDFTAYRVALADQSNNQTIWQSGKLKATNRGGTGVLNIRFPARLLKSQIYTLQVSGISPDGKTELFSSYSFKVMRQ